MDNIYLDTYYFFVPNRIVWEHWKQFQGENTESAWLPTTEYTVPQITAPEGGFAEGTIADYFGIPTKVPGLSVNALPFRAYALICNEWFRDQNLCDPLNIPLSDATVVGVNTGNFVTDVAKGGLPYKAAKYHDYFTSALPAPQKGPDVGIGLTGNADVVGGLKLKFSDPVSGRHPESGQLKVGSSPAFDGSVPVSMPWRSDTNNGYADVAVDGLSAALGTASAVTINELRLAFQMQRLLEKDSRSGTRYVEVLKAHFGVTSPDARLQRPEYLGGNRIPISVSQTIQTSQTTQESPLGDTGAYSLTVDSHSDFTRSFTEHGFVIGLMVARYDHTYQNGLERQWSRKTRFDYYFPVLANIGEQAIKNKEIYATGTKTDDEVFGYQEAWADYRYKPSRVTGEMRSNSSKTLDFWHVADKYSELPKLSAAWIFEDKSNVDRVLEVTSQVANQLFADIYIRNYTTRPMPLYSIPGLVDHH
nr:MAG: major capsid protein [Microviridae sp.]